MSHLVEAIEAEARGDFGTALEHYANLTESGSSLDRVGIFRALGDHLTAAKYFFDTAEVMSEQASTSGDAELREATILVYERAMDSATKAGRADVARVAQMRAYDLRQTK